MALSGLNSLSEQKVAPPNWRGFFLAVVVTTFFFCTDCGIIRHSTGLTDIQFKARMLRLFRRKSELYRLFS